jgi:hypothetical protein
MLIGKLFGRPRRRWEDNIQIDLREMGCEDQRWMILALDRIQRWGFGITGFD